ncbi:hypothetical protein [Desulfotruncus alcoholivorax]|uniref:hypothetical protein n=1 Tax=Desulfotruncus alcoholivorax TaxID=265477 RepID=UPI00040B0F5B|nr:hypothetical protein [Desulfotruncus alcoholivorax]
MNEYKTQDKQELKKLKRVVVKEEYVKLTGDIAKAIILNQFIYWSERVQDFDKFITEEQERCQQDGTKISIQLSNGWIYKSSEELSSETMLNISASNIRNHLKDLIKNGWISERTNPVHKWDRTKQYRVNLAKISKDLLKLGYVLQDYKVDLPFFETKNAFSVLENGTFETENRNSNIENQTLQNRKAIPEITTEITNRDYLSIHPSANRDNVILDNNTIDGSMDGWIDGNTEADNDREELSKVNKLIKELCLSTGASPGQVQKAIRRANQIEEQGKLKGNYLGLVESIARTIIKEDLVKRQSIDGGEVPRNECKAKNENENKRDLIKSLYRN